MTNPIKVPHSGPEGASILVIGEAPSSDESRLRQPFVGTSGEILRAVLIQNGFSCASPEECEKFGIDINNKYDVRFANLVNYQPDNNNFSSLSESEVKDGIRELTEYIQKWKSNIKVCIALGSNALHYITGKYGIDRWRGSIIEVNSIPVISTYHPAYIARVRKDYPIFTFDIGRARKIYLEGFKQPRFNFVIDPDGYKLEEIIYDIKTKGKVAVDIETVRDTNRILCCGFGTSNTDAYCIINRTEDVSLESSFRRFCSTILEDENIEKIFHNGLYDVEVFHNNHVYTKGFKHDTMIAQHVINPEMPKRLDFITSIYTDIPYYKDKGKMVMKEGEEKGWNPKNVDTLTLYEYNCLDVVSTFWCLEEMLKEIHADPDLDLIYKQEMDMHEVAFELTRNGMLRDNQRTEEIKRAVQQKFIIDQAILDAIVGKSINVGSPAQKKKLLYEIWGLPERTGKNSKVASDEDAIVSLISYTKDYISGLRKETTKYEWQKKLVGLMIILKLQGYRKLLGSYIDIDIHPDNRIRSSYKITGAETGRWSCSKYLDDTGLNAQTMPRDSIEI